MRMVLNEAQTVKHVLFICHLVKLGSKGIKGVEYVLKSDIDVMHYYSILYLLFK